MPITTDVVSLNLDQGEVYNISDKVMLTCFLLFSQGPLVSSSNKTDCQDITEI